MVLADTVNVARRFQRSVRIDSDYTNKTALEGYVCPKSSADVLLAVSHHVAETGHSAFTWTGPYGSGKSSLVVALSTLLGGNTDLQASAEIAIGKKVTGKVRAALPLRRKGWITVPVVGRRDDVAHVIGKTLEELGLASALNCKGWTDDTVISTLIKLSKRHPRSEGGLILFIDEMGKFLEAVIQEGADIYFFQLLAEAASRSDGRLVVIGILHQSFEEYANRLSREMRDEWSKIQGRYIDLSVNTAGEEQIELVSRAIENGRGAAKAEKLASLIASEIKQQRPAASDHLPQALEGCWPLHPVVACLLGPISRRRFGQNQRSIFGFLNSAEPSGFQDFIRNHAEDALYEPDRLWDYLRINLEPSILASPDGHRWAMAAEAIERCDVLGGDALHIRLLKSIALIDLFKERSGLLPTISLLNACVSDMSSEKVTIALDQLKARSLIIFRKFTTAYAIYAGSDFDIDRAIKEARINIQEVDFSAMHRLAGPQPVLAKRHYHETGALRWFDVEITPLKNLIDRARSYAPKNGTIGAFLLAVPTEGETSDTAQSICREAARKSRDWDIVTGLSQRAWVVIDLARELIALAEVQDEHPDLTGDAVAQRELQARHAALQGQLEEEIRRAFDNATWYQMNRKPQQWFHNELNNVASELAGRRFPQSPRLNNELLNRVKPSSNAIAAQNALLRAMVSQEGVARLGITGFPAEGGLYASLLETTGVHVRQDGTWRFCKPPKNNKFRLAPLWQETTRLLKDAKDRTVSVSEIYDLWSAPPYGVKNGVMPVLIVAFILSRREKIAVYREGVFQARFKDIDVEILAKNPHDIHLRWMDLSALSKRMLSSMAEVVRELSAGNSLTHQAPIDVARGLIAIFDRLRPWTKRTTRLSENAVQVRDLFKLANDPNKFLFDDIPAVFGERGALDNDNALSAVVDDVRDGLQELVQSYPSMLRRLKELMLTELQVPNMSPQAIAELRARAKNVLQVSGDFRLNAFVGRLASFEDATADIEGIASLAANKPPRDWSDPDLDSAAIELTDLAQKFIRSENFARVKGRVDKRHAMAVVIGVNGRPTPVHAEFEVTDGDRKGIDEIISRLENVINAGDKKKQRLLLAALAELSTRYMPKNTESPESEAERALS